MIWTLGLLVIPVIVIVTLYAAGKGRIDWKELAALLGVALVCCSATVAIGLKYKTTSTEIWNGHVARKDHDTWTSCCHCHTETYPCGTDSNGHTKTCSRRVCSHSHDQSWTATSSNDETVYSSTCNPPYASEPADWTRIRIGEPTAQEHSYTNYIRAAGSSSILRSRGVAARFAGQLPDYPRVRDFYRIDRVINAGAAVPATDLQTLQAALDRTNDRLGAARQVNITAVLTSVSDRGFAEGLRERWVDSDHGAEKNDFTVVIGLPEYPRIGWVEFVTWTRNERVKDNVRTRIEALPAFDAAAVAHIIENEVDNNFVRTPMAEYEYLYATVTPPTWILVLGWLITLAVTGVLGSYFWVNDPFEKRHRNRTAFSSRRYGRSTAF